MVSIGGVRLNTHDIECFLKVCETKSFNSAAAALYLSPQGLSNTIRRLEKELNVQLFNWHNNGVTLTDYGTVFIRYANDILSDSQASVHAIEALRAQNEH